MRQKGEFTLWRLSFSFEQQLVKINDIMNVLSKTVVFFFPQKKGEFTELCGKGAISCKRNF